MIQGDFQDVFLSENSKTQKMLCHLLCKKIKIGIHTFIFRKLNRKYKEEIKPVAYVVEGWYLWSGIDREGNETPRF